MSVKFNPSRLKLARTRRQLTFKTLASEVGLTPRMVSEYEKDYCNSEPPEATVEAFSRALNYPPEFLLDEDAIENVSKDTDRKSTRLNSSHANESRMPSSA